MIATVLLILGAFGLVSSLVAMTARHFTSMIFYSLLSMVFLTLWAYIKEKGLTDQDINQGFNTWIDGIPQSVLIGVTIIGFIVLLIGSSSGLDNALSRFRNGGR